MARNGKKLVKLFGIIGALVVVGIVLLVVVALGTIDTIAKTAIVKGGSYATGVDTTAESVDIRLLAGTFQMTGFDIANPEGFESPHFFGMDNTKVALSIGTLRQDTIRLPELTLADIEVYLEGSGDNANYNQILNNLKRFESSDKTEDGKEKEKSDSGKSFVIDVVTIDGISVNVAGIPGISQAVGDVAIQVPKIELLGLGKDGGMSMAEIVNVIIKTVLSATIEAGGGVIPTAVLNQLGGQLAQLESLGDLGITAVGNVGDIAGQLGTEATKALDEAGGALDDAAKGIEEGINDLFGGGDKDKKK
jgi:hypothetical protein